MATTSSGDETPLFQIGEVAERVGLSIRTIRYYEEIELVVPSGRTEGGFRLYGEDDIRRLELAKALKPTGLSLEDLVDFVALASSPALSTNDRRRLSDLTVATRARITRLDERLKHAVAVLDDLENS
ncbi:MAG TPA: MerR family transcriptional regulator [Actinobacteria bacterium]|nr:MerR family transcriptional regulator [Actinomycetota bacterium]